MSSTSILSGGATLAHVHPTEAPAIAGVPSAMIQPLSMQPGALGGYALGAGGGLYKNLESYPGQILYTPPKLSARQEGKRARKDSIVLARHAERTSEHIRGGLDRKTNMVVGTMLRVHPQPDWEMLGLNDGEDGWEDKKPFAKACQREFMNWANDHRLTQDGEGHYNFGGMMWMAYRNLIGPDAECVGVINYDEERQRRLKCNWATYVTMIDPDRVETPPIELENEIASRDYEICEGRKLDKHGRMIGFWVANRHPSEGIAVENETLTTHTFVPRETDWGRPVGFHWFFKRRAGQQRGVTNLVTVLKAIGQLDGFDDAYLGAAIVNQVLSNYIETMASAETVAEQLAPGPNGGPSAWDNKLNYYDHAKIRIGGTRIPVMPPGDKVMMTAVNRAIGDPSQFRNGFLRMFASAIGVTFEQVSLNYSDANYSAARAALLEVWRGVLAEREMFTQHVCTQIYGAVIEEAIYKGRITLPPGAPPFQENRAAYTRCAWTGPGMGWIDPQKEANAIETMMRIRLKSRAEAKAEMDGGDYLETFDQIEQEQMEAEERDFSLELAAPGTPTATEDATAEEGDANTKPKKKAGAGTKDGDGDGQINEGAAA